MTFRTLLRVAVFSAVVLFVTPIAYGQSDVMTAKVSSEILHLMRKEKLDLILPGAMRDNNI